MGSYDHETPRTATGHAATDVAETEEVKQLRSKYEDPLAKLRELFDSWKEEDLLFALQEANGDLENTIGRIMEGHANQWEIQKKKSKKEHSNKVKPSGQQHQGSQRGNYQRGSDRSDRPDRGDRNERGRSRGDGGHRGGKASGRSGHQRRENGSNYQKPPRQQNGPSSAHHDESMDVNLGNSSSWGKDDNDKAPRGNEESTQTNWASTTESGGSNWFSESTSATADSNATNDGWGEAKTKENTSRKWDSDTPKEPSQDAWSSEHKNETTQLPKTPVATKTTPASKSQSKLAMSWAQVVKDEKSEPKPETASGPSKGSPQLRKQSAAKSPVPTHAPPKPQEPPLERAKVPTPEPMVTSTAKPDESAKDGTKEEQQTEQLLSANASPPVIMPSPRGKDVPTRVPPKPKSQSTARRLNQETPVVMPNPHVSLDRLSVQFGSVSLANDEPTETEKSSQKTEERTQVASEVQTQQAQPPSAQQQPTSPAPSAQPQLSPRQQQAQHQPQGTQSNQQPPPPPPSQSQPLNQPTQQSSQQVQPTQGAQSVQQGQQVQAHQQVPPPPPASQQQQQQQQQQQTPQSQQPPQQQPQQQQGSQQPSSSTAPQQSANRLPGVATAGQNNLPSVGSAPTGAHVNAPASGVPGSYNNNPSYVKHQEQSSTGYLNQHPVGLGETMTAHYGSYVPSQPPSQFSMGPMQSVPDYGALYNPDAQRLMGYYTADPAAYGQASPVYQGRDNKYSSESNAVTANQSSNQPTGSQQQGSAQQQSQTPQQGQPSYPGLGMHPYYGYYYMPNQYPSAAFQGTGYGQPFVNKYPMYNHHPHSTKPASTTASPYGYPTTPTTPSTPHHYSHTSSTGYEDVSGGGMHHVPGVPTNIHDYPKAYGGAAIPQLQSFLGNTGGSNQQSAGSTTSGKSSNATGSDMNAGQYKAYGEKSSSAGGQPGSVGQSGGHQQQPGNPTYYGQGAQQQMFSNYPYQQTHHQYHPHHQAPNRNQQQQYWNQQS